MPCPSVAEAAHGDAVGPGTAQAAAGVAGSTEHGRSSGALAWGLMLASGAAGLGLQIVWTQQASLWLGHESAGVLAVVAAFFGGLALGALLLGARIERSNRPQHWYAACELTIAAWGLLLALSMAPAGGWLLQAMGERPGPLWQWLVAFGGTGLLLLPATAAMGATLPAMARLLSPTAEESRPMANAPALTAPARDASAVSGAGAVGRRTTADSQGAALPPIAALYAANTAGAVLGVLLTALWLVPTFGLKASAVLCTLLNLACAITAWHWRPTAASPARAVGLVVHIAPASSASATVEAARTWTARSRPGAHIGPDDPARALRIQALLAATGLLGIGYEVLAVRVLSQVAENTVYTFALLLAVYLVGTALGAAACQRWLAATARHSVAWRDRLLAALAATCLLGTASLWWARETKFLLLDALGHSLPGALMAESALAVLAFGLPTLVMGALFSLLGLQGRDAGLGLGRALGINTLGAAAAPALWGVLLLPLLGAKLALLLLAAGYLALCSAAAWRRAAPWVTAAAVVVLALAAPPLALVDLPEGGRLVHYREGAMASVSVVADGDGVMRLHIDNRQQEGSNATQLADARQALLPLLLHPAPQRALFLGVGTGVTAAAAAQEASLQVDAVDLLPEVLDATRLFIGTQARPNLHLLASDARRYVRAAGPGYDLIVADNFHPARSGSGALYTTEHCAAVRGRLQPGGLFCQWLPLHQLDLNSLRSIVRSFLAVYPQASAVLATNSLETPVLGLLGRQADLRLNPVDARQRVVGLSQTLALPSHGLADDWAVPGSLLAGHRALAQWAGDAPLNTDDRPVVAYQAPAITYAPDSRPRDRLLSLVQGLGASSPDELFSPLPSAAWQARWSAYQRARVAFLQAGMNVRPSSHVLKMLAQVREPLLAVLRESPDFEPARAPLRRMAQTLAQQDPVAAQALLRALD